MNKRQFLKGTGSLISGSLLSHFAMSQKHTNPRTNWAGNQTFHSKQFLEPRTLEETQEIVKSCPKLRPVGTRHSFNAIADTTETQISLANFKDITLNPEAKTVTVGAGVRYGDLAPVIDAKGFALHNLASLPHISVAGATATGTHGSGIHNQNLSSSVSAIEFVAADGSVHTLSRSHDADSFPGAVVHLGCLGVVTSVTVDVEPTFQVAQNVYLALPFNELQHHLVDIFSAGYSVSIFTDWQQHRGTELWLKRRTKPGERLDTPALFYNAKLATRDIHPIPALDAINCTPQMGVPGPWYERLPHFKMNFTPSSGAELQTEYFVPLSEAYNAISAVETLRDRITPHLFVTELRTIAQDNLWLSMAFQRDSLAIHFTWKPEWPAVQKLLPLIEEKLAPFNPRPHWGKLFTLSPAKLQQAYPKMNDYKALIRKYDPTGKFRNEFMDTEIFGP